MPTLTLTDRNIQAIKPKAARVEYVDRKMKGLALRVTSTGAKSWAVRYRHRGRLRRLTLGTLDVVTLAQARERARDLLHEASKGVDVATVKQAGRTAQTFADLAELYLTKYAMVKKRSWKADRNLLNRKVLPKWKHRALVDIERPDCLRLVEGVAETAPIVANRVAALLSKVFAYALDQNLVKASPAVRIPRPGQERQRDRVLSDAELRTLWTAWDALPAAMAAFYRLRLLTAQRGAEVASMRWSDVDLDSGWWTIPATVAKNKLAHRVPLNGAAARVLAALLATADAKAVYVLESSSRSEKGSGARGKRQQSEAAATFGVENFRGHDLRRTAATMMASGGVPRLVVGKILNHQEPGVTKVYDRATYDSEKQAALAWWDAKLAAILEQKTATMLAFGRRA